MGLSDDRVHRRRLPGEPRSRRLGLGRSRRALPQRRRGPATTNQRMEINAALEAVTALDGPLEVVSDSTYVVNCFRDSWYVGWKRRGWTNSQKKPVANRDLWEPLIELYQQRGGEPVITFRWVKGHSGDPMNDLVDRLAVEAAATQAGTLRVARRSGSSRAGADLGVRGRWGRGGGPRPTRGSSADRRRWWSTGAASRRRLGGYGDNPTADRVRERLAEILKAKRRMHADLVVLTGLGLGAEQIGAEVAAAAGVPYVAVLPYPDQDAVWPAAGRQRFAKLLELAAARLGGRRARRRPPATKQAAGGALARRDAWLGRQADRGRRGVGRRRLRRRAHRAFPAGPPRRRRGLGARADAVSSAGGSVSTPAGRSPMRSAPTARWPRCPRRPTTPLVRSPRRSMRSVGPMSWPMAPRWRRTPCSSGAAPWSRSSPTVGSPTWWRSDARIARRSTTRGPTGPSRSCPASDASRSAGAWTRTARSSCRSTSARCSTLPTGADAVAVCLLHSDRSPAHEQAVAAATAGQGGYDVTCSHEISPEFREYERMVTTVANAYLRPACRPYLDSADHRSRRRGAGDDVGRRVCCRWPTRSTLPAVAAAVGAGGRGAGRGGGGGGQRLG